MASVQRSSQMRLIAFPLIGVAMLAGVVAFTVPAANQEGAPIFVTDIPAGYRDWRLISVAHEAGNLTIFAQSWVTILRSRAIARAGDHSRTVL